MEPKKEFVFDEDGMGGQGPLRSYFSKETRPDFMESSGLESTINDDPTLKSLVESTDERDDQVDRLTLQLFSEFSNISPEETVRVIWFDYPRSMRPVKKASKLPGLVLIGIQPDDPILGLYKDGQPIAAFYASYRGVYQAGGYVHSTGQHYFANDFADESFGPLNTWVERQTACSEIAESFLLGRRGTNE